VKWELKQEFIFGGDNMNKVQEFKNDRGNFECYIEFIETCEEHEFNCRAKLTIDAYNTIVCAIDQIANKYKLHDEKRREYDVWYEHNYLWPKMKEFFNEKGSDYVFEQALSELWWYSDQSEPMTDFCNFIKKFAKDMKGSTKAEVIDLNDYGFSNNIYIASDIDEGEGLVVLEGGDFIKYTETAMSTLDDEYKEIWAKEIFKIIEKYE
jgi:hypothetical protein